MAGERFMEKYDSRLELATRDVVARSIYDQMMTRKEPHALLDISHKGRDYIETRFPNIFRVCLENGIDMTREPIPVTPTQHYTCGGVEAGLVGETSLPGLFACGEVAHSGLHGANRLASNSLLEGLVFAHRAVESSVAHAEHVLRDCQRQFSSAALNARQGRTLAPMSELDTEFVSNKKAELKNTMWAGCGIIRNLADLQKAESKLLELSMETSGFKRSHGISSSIVELDNMISVGYAMVKSAVSRRESRGGHFMADYPSKRSSYNRPTVLNKKDSRKR